MLQICRRVVAGNRALTILLGEVNSGSYGVLTNYMGLRTT